MTNRQPHGNLRLKVRNELRAFLIITIFFAVVLGSFNVYRRLILGEVGVTYSHYGISWIEAMILAKIVLIGDAMHPKAFAHDRRSIFEVAMLKSIIFVVLVWLFTLLERIVEGLIRRADWESIARSFVSHGLHELVARLIMMFAAFLPFFALWELRRRIGARRFFDLWFSRATAGWTQDGVP